MKTQKQKQALIQSPNKQALIHSPNKQALIHSPNKQALIHSPNKQSQENRSRKTVNSYQEEDKENVDRLNLQVLINEQKMTEPNKYSSITEITQQSVLIECKEAVDISYQIQGNIEDSIHFEQQRQNLNNFDSKQNSSLLKKFQKNKQCFDCEIKRLEYQKEFANKEIIIWEKNNQEKSLIRQQLNKKQTLLWEQCNQHSQRIIRLQQQNRHLSYEVEKLQFYSKQEKKNQKKLFQQKQKSLKRHFQQSLNLYKKQREIQKISDEQKIKNLNEQVIKLKQQSNAFKNEMYEAEIKFQSRTLSYEEQHLSMISTIKKHFQTKATINDERVISQIQTISSYYRLLNQQLIDQIQSQQIIISQKSSQIQNLLTLIDSLATAKQTESFIQVEQNMHNISVLNEIKIFRSQSNQSQRFSNENLGLMSEVNNLKEKISELQNKNQLLNQKLLRKKQIHFQLREFSPLSQEMLQQTAFSEPQQKISSSEPYSKESSTTQKQLLTKSVIFLKKQLQIKHQQLFSRQQIIKSLQNQLENLQKLIQTHYKSKIQQQKFYEQKIQQLNQLMQQNTFNFNLMSQKQQLQIQQLKNSLDQKQNQQKTINNSPCHHIRCQQICQLFYALKEKYQKQQQQYFLIKQQHANCSFEIQKTKNNLVTEFQFKYNKDTKQFFQKTQTIYESNLLTTKKSYQKILTLKKQELNQLNQILSHLIHSNYQLHCKYKQTEKNLHILEKKMNQRLNSLIQNCSQLISLIPNLFNQKLQEISG